jgi:NAD(P)-dependent dehydrogenase (short-subunit alcohol dehydrogenase family)
MSTPHVWLITGSSTGFGRTIAEQALKQGHWVVLTARKPEALADLVALYPDTAKAVALDVTEPAQARAAIAEAVKTFGRIDVLVNNAGYGLLGALEELTDDQIRRNLETNLIGPLNVMRAAIPQFREQKSGHIINITAIAAFHNEVGFSVYGGAKAALEAASESVKGELAPFGVKVTLVVPGPFRTDFIGRSLERVAEPMPEYLGTVGTFGATLNRINGRQPGDPVKAAEAILEITRAEKPPFRLVLGNYATTKFHKKLKALGEELEQWEAVGKPTDFPLR